MAEPVRLYVGGLPPLLKRSELEQRFAPFGTISSVDILPPKTPQLFPDDAIVLDFQDGESKLCRGFAYVDFIPANPGSLHKCYTAYNGSKWKGGKLRIEEANEHYMARLQKEWSQAQQDKKAEAEQSKTTPATAEPPADPSLPSFRKQIEPINVIWGLTGIKTRTVPADGGPGSVNKHKRSFQNIPVPPLSSINYDGTSAIDYTPAQQLDPRGDELAKKILKERSRQLALLNSMFPEEPQPRDEEDPGSEPEIQPEPEAEPEAISEPAPEPTSEPTSKPTPEPTSEPTPEPEPEQPEVENESGGSGKELSRWDKLFASASAEVNASWQSYDEQMEAAFVVPADRQNESESQEDLPAGAERKRTKRVTFASREDSPVISSDAEGGIVGKEQNWEGKESQTAVRQVTKRSLKQKRAEKRKRKVAKLKNKAKLKRLTSAAVEAPQNADVERPTKLAKAAKFPKEPAPVTDSQVAEEVKPLPKKEWKQASAWKDLVEPDGRLAFSLSSIIGQPSGVPAVGKEGPTPPVYDVEGSRLFPEGVGKEIGGTMVKGKASASDFDDSLDGSDPAFLFVRSAHAEEEWLTTKKDLVRDFRRKAKAVLKVQNKS